LPNRLQRPCLRAKPLPQLTAAAVGSPWQVPRSQPDGLAVALTVLGARRALWESISAREDVVVQWLSTPFELLDICNEVLLKRHAADARAHCRVYGG
jgi:hypothetical protein